MIFFLHFVTSLIFVEHREKLFVFTNDYKYVLKKSLSSFYPKNISYSGREISMKEEKKEEKKENDKKEAPLSVKEVLYVEGETNSVTDKLPVTDKHPLSNKHLLSKLSLNNLPLSNILPLSNNLPLSKFSFPTNKQFIDSLFIKDNYLFSKERKLIYLDDITAPIYFNNVMILLSQTNELISYLNIFFVLRKKNLLITDLFSFYKREICTSSVVGVNSQERMSDKLDGVHLSFNFNGVNLLFTLCTNKKNILILRKERTKKRNFLFFSLFFLPFLFLLRKKKTLLYKGKNYSLYESTFNNKRVIIKEYKDKEYFEKEEKILSTDSLHINYLFKKNKLVIFDYSESFFTGVTDTVSFSHELSKLLYSLKRFNLSFTSLDPINLRVKNNKPILLNYDKERVKEYMSKSIILERNTDITINNSINEEYSLKECASSLKDSLSWESESVFLLGIIIHLLIYKSHPYDIEEEEKKNDEKKNDEKEDSFTRIERNIINDIRHPINRLMPSDFLIRGCLQKRLSLSQLLVHPFFWSFEKKFLFLASLSDVLEKKDATSFKLFKRLERNKHHIFTNDWIDYLDSVISKDLFVFREYTNTVQGLLRAIRNKGRHYVELPSGIKSIYKSFPDGFMSYYEDKFDGLIMISYISGMIVRSEDVLKGFYICDV